MLKKRGPSLEVVHGIKGSEAVAIISTFSIGMRANHLLEAISVSIYLSTHITHDNSYAIPQDIIDQLLELLIVILLICIFMVIGKCIALYSHNLYIWPSHTSIACESAVDALPSRMRVMPLQWMQSCLHEYRIFLPSQAHLLVSDQHTSLRPRMMRL